MQYGKGLQMGINGVKSRGEGFDCPPPPVMPSCKTVHIAQSTRSGVQQKGGLAPPVPPLNLRLILYLAGLQSLSEGFF